MTISTKTNSTALSYLSIIITNKTVEMIEIKIFKFVEVATQSRRHSGFFKVLRGHRGHLIALRRVWMASGVSSSARSHSFRLYRSFGAMVITTWDTKSQMGHCTRTRDVPTQHVHITCSLYRISPQHRNGTAHVTVASQYIVVCWALHTSGDLPYS